MTSHELGQMLLEMPNKTVLIPRVLQYDETGFMLEPVLVEYEAERVCDNDECVKEDVILIVGPNVETTDNIP